MDAIVVRGVSKRFLVSDRAEPRSLPASALRWVSGRESHREVWALRGVDLAVERGEAVGVVGPNGSGKTTLLLAVAGLLAPTAGTVEVSGRVDPFFQLAAGLHPRFTVLENFSLCATLLGMDSARYRRLLPAIVEFSGLEDYLHARYGELSSGMAARVAFSVAVHAELDIILIDEALAVGDKSFQSKCRAVFEEFKRQGKTLLLVSHDPGVLESLCTKVLYLREGRVVCYGEPRDGIARYWSDIYGFPSQDAPAAQGLAPAEEAPSEPPAQRGSPAVETGPAEAAAEAPAVGAPAAREAPARADVGGWERLSEDLREALAAHLGVPREHLRTMPPQEVPAFVGYCLAEKVGPGDEVLVPGNAPLGLLDILLRNQWVPAFVDVDLPNHMLDFGLLPQAVGPRTRAAVLVHGIGSCDLEDAVRACSERGLTLIEHCPAVGSTWRGRPLGTFGSVGIFSFDHLLGPRTAIGLNAVAVDPSRARFPHSLAGWIQDRAAAPPDLLASALDALRNLSGRVEEYRRLRSLCRTVFAAFPDWFVLPGGDEGVFSILCVVKLKAQAPCSRDEVLAVLNEGGAAVAGASIDRNPLRHPFYAGIPHRAATPLPRVAQIAEQGINIRLMAATAAGLEARLAAVSRFLEKRAAGGGAS